MFRKTYILILAVLLVFAPVCSASAQVHELETPILSLFRRAQRTKPQAKAKPQTKAKPQPKAKSAPAPRPDNYAQKVSAFLSDLRWRPGTVYNGSQRPKLSRYNCVGCCAYAADFVQYVFGKNSPRAGTPFTSLTQVRAGDLIELSGPSHWIVVLGRNGNSLNTVEGNWTDGKVERNNGAYTVNGNTLMRKGKKFRTFARGYHFR